VISEGFAQKIIERSWNSKTIERIEIISGPIFNIRIISEATEKILVITKIEGEHYENVVLEGLEKNKTLSLAMGYTPYFIMANDKLAAHKMISIEMEIHLPKNLEVVVKASIASLETVGVFKTVHATLDNGNCVLTNFKGDATIHTKNGNITVYAQETVSAVAKTKRGKLINQLPKTGVFLINATSVNGDITLLKSQ